MTIPQQCVTCQRNFSEIGVEMLEYHRTNKNWNEFFEKYFIEDECCKMRIMTIIDDKKYVI